MPRFPRRIALSTILALRRPPVFGCRLLVVVATAETAIPTLSEWSLLVLALLTAMVAVRYLRRT
jgi:hypothetical protein